MIPAVELRHSLYNIIPTLGWFFISIILLIQHKKFTIGYCAKFFQKLIPNKKIYTPVKITEILLTFIMLPLSVSSLNTWFGEVMKTGPNYYGFLFFYPIVLLLFCIVLWVDPIKRFDFLAPHIALSLVFIRLGCFFYGCCGGIKCDYGLYNYHTERTEIPTQLLEVFLGIGIFVFFMWWRKKAKPGTMYPMYMILYSFFRFFIEFTSSTYTVYFRYFNRYHLLCLVGMIIGIALLMLMTEYGEKISTYFEENPYGFMKALIEKIKSPKKQRLKNKKG